jgi:putative Holliday junction resolvase
MYNPARMTDQGNMRVMAVDWGVKRIGLAISDPSGTIAYPLGVIFHSSRGLDTKCIVEKSLENHVEIIIIGVTYDDDNNLTPSGRSAKRLANEISRLSGKQVILRDEAFTTLQAKLSRIQMGASRKKRKGHQDDIAAVILLQDYLESKIP